MKPVHWNDIRDEICGLLETRERGHLFAVLDELAKELDSNGVEPVLYVDERPFGEPILDEALKSIDTMDSSNRLKTQMHFSGKFPSELAYAPIPLGLILENAVEIFDPRNIRHPFNDPEIVPKVHHAPLKLLFSGDFFGVFETLDYLSSAEAKSHDPWTMFAGARSVQVTFSLAREMAPALSEALKIFGLDYDPTGGALKSATDHEALWQLASALAPAWKVRYALFPEHWLYEESVSDSVRVRFEHYFFNLGWHQAQPLMKSAMRDADFRDQWDRRLKKESLGEHTSKYGKFAFNLFLIDRCIQPCLVDLRSALTGPACDQVKQLLPAAELLAFFILLEHIHSTKSSSASKRDPRSYSSILVPGYLNQTLGAGYLSLFRDDIPKLDGTKSRIEFLARTLSMLGVELPGRSPLYEPHRIDPKSLTLVLGAPRYDNVYDFDDCQIPRRPPRNDRSPSEAQYPLPDSVWEVIEKKDIVKRLGGDGEARLSQIARAHEEVLGLGKKGLKYLIRFVRSNQ